MLVDLGVLEEYPSNTIPGFNEALDGAAAHARGPRLLAGPSRRLPLPAARGTWLGHVAEHIALELQNLAGTDVRIGKTRSAGDARPVQRDLRVPRGAGGHRGRQDGRRAGQPPRRARRSGADFDLPARAGAAHPPRRAAGVRAVDAGDHRRGGQSRDIPWIRLDRHSLVQLGQGVHQQRIRATMTSRTSGHRGRHRVGQGLTNQLLSSAGLPVPRSRDRRARGRGGRPRRSKLGYPVRRQAARRQPRPRRGPRPAHRGRRARARSAARSPRAAAATWSWRPTSTATTTGCWSSAARWSPSRSASRRASTPTASTPSRSWWRSRTPTRVAASATRRC